MEELIKEDEIIDDRTLAKLLFKERCKPTSWRTIQKMARQGLIKGRQIGMGGWVFHRDAVRDFLMRPAR